MQIRQNQRVVSNQSSLYQSNHSSKFVCIGYFVCPICECGYTTPDIVSWGTCHHQFCVNCVRSHIQSAVGSLSLPTCPEYSCKEKLDLKGQLYQSLPSSLKAKIHKVNSYKQIIANPNFKPCQQPECSGSFNISKTMKCQLCHSKHCKKCFALYHDGQCEVHVAVHLEMTKKYRQCGRCGQVIEKVQGCTHMTCTCGNYFCYSCGQPLVGDHQCKAPEDLNCMQSLRWQIQHLQFWYETTSCTLLRVLLLFSPPASWTKQAKLLWVFFFTLLFYPLLLVVALALAFAAVCVLIALGVILSSVLPFTAICGGNSQLFPNYMLAQNCGCFFTLIIILAFYPIFYIVNIIQMMYELIHREGLNIFIPFIEIAHGVKLVILFPCLMMVDNEQFYLSTVKLRQTDPPMLISLDESIQ